MQTIYSIHSNADIIPKESDNQGILRCNQKIIKMAKRNCAELLYIAFNYWLQTKSTTNINKEKKKRKKSLPSVGLQFVTTLYHHQREVMFGTK